MKRREINKKHGMAYTFETMTKAIEKSGLDPKQGVEFNEKQVEEIEKQLATMPKDLEAKRLEMRTKREKK